MTNIKGSFNGSDILRSFNSIDNIPKNFYRLFLIHDSIGFDDNLSRLVEATNAIIGTGHQFNISSDLLATILDSPARAERFYGSTEYDELKADLDQRVAIHRHTILVASLIQNVNVRGRVIEYLVAGEDDSLREELIQALLNNQHGIPRFSTENSLGDYTKFFESYHTETDVKTKVMALDSNPKAYNIDKMLEFLSKPQSVFMFYFIGIDPGKIFNTSLVSMFDRRIMSGTLLLKHWAGRNSRGVTQLEGKSVKAAITSPDNLIDLDNSRRFIQTMIDA